MSFPNDEIDMANESFVCISSDQANEIREFYTRLIDDGRVEAEARQATKEYISMMREEYIFEKETEEFEEFVTKAIEESTGKEGQNCEEEKTE
ncbi:hypothetical protein K443DRAFT_684070 [Laccaria amethystina LaAM-08-1]|uniref:Uncharacterized protein n=1 Tax=Laccaria amethystina LaAM-08-1 TaxID=1095629 RepID=A0A0C9WYM8_9AGAR|nr:hypothetical protein K443DRAFT_684070 [Laccaria amethystina LaAM-08-1]